MVYSNVYYKPSCLKLIKLRLLCFLLLLFIIVVINNLKIAKICLFNLVEYHTLPFHKKWMQICSKNFSQMKSLSRNLWGVALNFVSFYPIRHTVYLITYILIIAHIYKHYFIYRLIYQSVMDKKKGISSKKAIDLNHIAIILIWPLKSKFFYMCNGTELGMNADLLTVLV